MPVLRLQNGHCPKTHMENAMRRREIGPSFGLVGLSAKQTSKYGISNCCASKTDIKSETPKPEK